MPGDGPGEGDWLRSGMLFAAKVRTEYAKKRPTRERRTENPVGRRDPLRGRPLSLALMNNTMRLPKKFRVFPVFLVLLPPMFDVPVATFFMSGICRRAQEPNFFAIFLRMIRHGELGGGSAGHTRAKYPTLGVFYGLTEYLGFLGYSGLCRAGFT